MKKTNDTKSMKSIGEFGLIAELKRNVRTGNGVIFGIGDDTAVLRLTQGKELLYTIDTIVEGVDFTADMPWRLIGRKALAVNLSDIAAMGGTARMAVVSLILPAHFHLKRVRQLFSGLHDLAKQYQVDIVGGDLSRGPKVVCTIAMIGEVSPGGAVFRHGAKKGDLICVTGSLGGSILGKHLKFEPRQQEGDFLRRFGVTSMIDISDGLIQDLNHIMDASQKGYKLYESAVPISQSARRLASKSGKPVLQHALYDGEDFELLFTVGKNKIRGLMNQWQKRFRTKCSIIGEVVANSAQRPHRKKKSGFTHF